MISSTEWQKYAADTISTMWCREVERLLLTELEKIIGRVPSNDEVSRYACCLIFPDGVREYKWKGITILRVIGWDVGEDDKFVLNHEIPKS